MIDNSGKGLAALGRNEDRFMAHVAQGEMVVPPVISDNTRNMIRQEMAAVGLNPNEYQVGEGMSINPITGQAEFGFLKKLAKSVKKVVKKIAPIAAVIPGPWQPFAAVYQKGSAALRVVKGEGGLGDIMTLMAGGNQSLGGKDGAFNRIGEGFSGNFGADKGFFGSLGDIGKVTDAATNKSSYDLFGYGKNVAKGMASDQKQGYFGAFGGGTGKFDVNTGLFENYDLVPQLDLAGNTVFDAKGNIQYADSTQGFNPLAPKRHVVQSGDTLFNIAKENGMSVAELQELNGITGTNINPGQIIQTTGGNIFNKTGNLIRGAGSGAGDAIKSLVKGGAGVLSAGTASSGAGINPQMAALALLYGKAVKDAARKTEGGMTDIRQSLRPDLNPQPVYSGFDLGIRGAATGGPINRQYFANGGPSDSVKGKKVKNNYRDDIDYSRDTIPGTPEDYEKKIYLLEKSIMINEIDYKDDVKNNIHDIAKNRLDHIRKMEKQLKTLNDEYTKIFYPSAIKKANGGLAAIGELDMRDGGESEGPGTGTSDDIPAMLSDGEFVMTAAANNGAGGFQLNKTKKGL